MRRSRGRLIFWLLVLVAGAAAVAESPGPLPASQDWWSAVEASIAESEYAVRSSGAASSPTWQAANRAQDLRTHFSEAGIRVVPRTTPELPWTLELSLVGCGRSERDGGVERAACSTEGNRITCRRDGITEWYVNDRRGLEQGFTLDAAPPGDAGDPVSVELEMGGDLSAYPAEDGRSILFKRGDLAVLRYTGLKVVDASGRELPARLDVAPGILRILFDDLGASYPVVVDPWLTGPAWTRDGNQDSSEFGWSVATAGDVDGDGFSDVLVSAPDFDEAGSNRGKVFLFRGSPSGPGVSPDWNASGPAAFSQFGQSVATAGDVDDDGYHDVIVGCPECGADGAVYVYHGSPSGLSTTPDWTVVGTAVEQNHALGESVATAGDVNGDGYDDVIIGDEEWSVDWFGFSREGKAYVYHGSSSGLASTPAWSVAGCTGSFLDCFAGHFGDSVSTAGDVNGDGFADVIVGARFVDNVEADEGHAYIYHGSASGLSLTAARELESDQAMANFGNSVSTAGDVNADGYSDVIIGAIGWNGGQSNEGRAYLYYGSASGIQATPAWTVESDDDNSEFAESVATAGDVNGDGYADVLVGGPKVGTGGVVQLYLGSSSGLPLTPDWDRDGGQSGAWFGFSAATAGDVNGDGYSDIVVGERLYTDDQSEEGRAYVFFGAGEGPKTTTDWTLESDLPSTAFGQSVASAGDVNGDGYSDLIVGATGYDNGQNDEGGAWVYHGSPSGPELVAAWSAEGDQEGALFGQTVATAGDVNGDGYDDVIVSAVFYSNGQEHEGRAYVYMGSPTGLQATAVWTVEGNELNAELGAAGGVAGAGDVNGDGYADVIVGAHAVDYPRGRAYVYLGTPSGLAATPAWTAQGNAFSSFFGASVAAAGDVDADGYSDVIVGATGDYDGLAGAGSAFVYHGSASGLETSPRWFVAGEQTKGVLGNAVSSAGDVDGDGYSDVIVGAYFIYAPQPNYGRAFVYHGSAEGLSPTPDWSVVDDEADSNYGISVASAGDVNGDAYGDVIVGARLADNPEFGEGRAYLYLGSASGVSSTPAWITESDTVGAQYGVDVASAGDVNGDGFSDVVVGAYTYTNGQQYEGRAYLYYGNGRDGLPRRPRQMRTDNSVGIGFLGRSDATDGFGLRAGVWMPGGRSRVRMQWEVEPLGSAFDGEGLGQGAWSDASSTSTGQFRNVFGLAESTPYAWRLRALSDSPFFPRTPWFSMPGNNITEIKVKTAGSDTDGDFVPDVSDNCPGIYNPDQRDGDGDGLGDACDTPEVAAVAPGDNAPGVPVWSSVTVTFNEPVDPATIDATSFVVAPLGGGALAGTRGLSANGVTLAFDPDLPLSTGTVYTVALTAAVRDLQGLPLPAFDASFQTSASSDPNTEDLSAVPENAVGQGDQTSEHHGTSLAFVGDVNGDGLSDWLVGAPDYDSGGLTDRGRALLYLGTTVAADRDVPDVIFLGVAAGDRAGISVEGGEDVDGDGVPDLLIGAEQHDGVATATGAGRAHLVYFDAADYPNLANPAMTDTVDLSAVADVTFTGVATGDRAGHSVDLSADIDGDARGEILIGAPGADRDAIVDRGEAYLVFSNQLLPSTVDLGQVGDTAQGATYDGVTYVGESAGDGLGWSVAAGEDFDADGTPDVMLGAPFRDTITPARATVSDAGAAYVDVGPMRRGVIEVDVYFGLDVLSHDGFVLQGDQADQHVGWSVALVPDNNLDGHADALAGAPGSNASAGEVFLVGGAVAGPARRGVIEVDAMRVLDNGIGTTFQATQAGAELGYSVATAGDVSGSGSAGLLMGSPGLDFGSPLETDIGGVYIVDDQPVPLGRGVIEVDAIGTDLPGNVYIGEEPGDRAGEAVAGGGDVNGDGVGDLLIGAPDADTSQGSNDDVGASYLVTEPPAPVPAGPPTCGPAGCTVVDLDTGSQIVVPAGSLAVDVPINVHGIANPAGLPATEPAGLTLVGAAELVPDARGFALPDPTIDLAARPTVESQLTTGESFDLYYFDGAGWTDSGIDAIEQANQTYPTSRAVAAVVDTLRTYAVFFADLDGDEIRDSLDPDRDGDGHDNAVDNCPDTPNPGQGDADGDTLGDACDDCTDTDDDGFGDPDFPVNTCPEDNCPLAPNPSQDDDDGDGVGNACDSSPVLRVSSDPADNPDYPTVQQAVDNAVQSGTRIEILNGLSGEYPESVFVDRGMVFTFRSGGGGAIVIDGGGGPAFDVRSTAGLTPMRFEDLTLRGDKGIEASVDTLVSGCTFDSIGAMALDLTGGSHEVVDTLIDGAAPASVLAGIDLAAGANLALHRTRLTETTGAALTVGGVAEVDDTLIDGAATGISLESTGSLDLRHSTIVGCGGHGIDNSLAGSLTVVSSIVHGNTTADMAGVACTDVSWSDCCTPDCSSVNDNVCADPLLDAEHRPQATSPMLDHGPDPATYTGMPCFDLDGGPRLRDHDGDGMAQVDVGAYERENPLLVPGPVSSLSWTDAATLTWTSEPSAVEYHVYRGTVSGLSHADFGSCADATLDPVDRTDTTLTDSGTPAPGESWFYVITAEDAPGNEGTTGVGTCAERSNFTPCP